MPTQGEMSAAVSTREHDSRTIPAAVGPRVRLVLLGAGGAEELAALLQQSYEFHREWVTYPTTIEQVGDFIANAPANNLRIFGVRHLADDTLIGIMTLSRIVAGAWQTAECGCAVGVDHRGHGYLTDAMHLLV